MRMIMKAILVTASAALALGGAAAAAATEEPSQPQVCDWNIGELQKSGNSIWSVATVEGCPVGNNWEIVIQYKTGFAWIDIASESWQGNALRVTGFNCNRVNGPKSYLASIRLGGDSKESTVKTWTC